MTEAKKLREDAHMMIGTAEEYDAKYADMMVSADHILVLGKGSERYELIDRMRSAAKESRGVAKILRRRAAQAILEAEELEAKESSDDVS